MKTAAAVIGIIVLLLGVTWLAQGNDFFMYKVFAPKYAEVQREVFLNTPSYKQGNSNEVRQYQAQYTTATDTQKQALASVILSSIPKTEWDKLPASQKAWLEELETKQLTAEVVTKKGK